MQHTIKQGATLLWRAGKALISTAVTVAVAVVIAAGLSAVLPEATGAYSSTPNVHAVTDGVLVPGGHSVTVRFSADNLSSRQEILHTIHLVTVGVPAGCVATDFRMADVVVDQSIAPGMKQAVRAVGHLHMMQTNTNQNACQDGALTLHFTSS